MRIVTADGTAQSVGDGGENRDHDQGMRIFQNEHQAVDESLHDRRQSIEEPGEIVREPIDDSLRRPANRNLVLR